MSQADRRSGRPALPPNAIAAIVAIEVAFHNAIKQVDSQLPDSERARAGLYRIEEGVMHLKKAIAEDFGDV